MTLKRARALSFYVAAGVALSSCGGDLDAALQHVCAAEDGQGKIYEASHFEMLDAVEDAMQRCETDAVDPATCVARGCRAGP